MRNWILNDRMKWMTRIPDRILWPLHVLIFGCQQCQWNVHIRCYALWLHAHSTLRMFSPNCDPSNSFYLCTKTGCFSISVWNSYGSSMVAQWNARTHVSISHCSHALEIFSSWIICNDRMWKTSCVYDLVHRMSPSVCQHSTDAFSFVSRKMEKKTLSVIQPACGICLAWSHGRENELGWQFPNSKSNYN